MADDIFQDASKHKEHEQTKDEKLSAIQTAVQEEEKVFLLKV